MAYTEWGESDNPRVLVCVHGLTRLGRDFDRLARSLLSDYRVICPDLVGRGLSDRLQDPSHYRVPQYVADMVTLIARLNVEHVDCVGTSMGGLIGIALAGQAHSPVRRLVLNDVGPRLDAAAVARIGEYVGQSISFDSVDAAVDYVSTIARPFGLTRRADWHELVEPGLVRDGARWKLHYDPRIAVPFAASTPAQAALDETVLWTLYDRIGCPTLVIRGEQSDLLSRATLNEMAARGPRARTVEIPGVGHAPTLMLQPEIDVVRTFLLDGANR